MGELVVLATVVAGGVTQLVSALKAVEAFQAITRSAWIVVACVLGVGGVFFLETDISSLPVNGPDWVARVVVGLFAGLVSAGLYETKLTISAHRKAVAKVAPTRKK